LIGAGVLVHQAGSASWAFTLYGAGILFAAFMAFFFRDPQRVSPPDGNALVAGADGRVRSIERIPEQGLLGREAVRISIYLSPWDVHINRAPLGGVVEALRYTPGKRLFTIQDAASEHNEHSSILIRGEATSCLVKQIVGPIVRRVVYWLQPNQTLQKGERIGLMKFGSRLDMYFPADEVEIRCRPGDTVRAGETIVAMRKDI